MGLVYSPTQRAWKYRLGREGLLVLLLDVFIGRSRGVSLETEPLRNLQRVFILDLAFICRRGASTDQKLEAML